MDKQCKTMGKRQIQEFDLPWPPSVNNYWRHAYIRGRPRVYISEKGKHFRESVYSEMMVQGYKPLSNARIGIVITAYPPNKRGHDLDNINKALLDSLEAARLFNNDNQIDSLHSIRGPIKKGGRLTVQVWSIDAEST